MAVYPEIRSILATTPARWLQLTATVPSELLYRQPKEGEWSAIECFHHLLITEELVFPVRMQAILMGHDFDAFDPDKDGEHTVGASDELAKQFAQKRADSLIAYDSLSVADLEKTARHPAFGIVTMRELIHAWAAHDLNHTMQAERSLMQPFIAGCRPWRGYFTDHDMQATQ